MEVKTKNKGMVKERERERERPSQSQYRGAGTQIQKSSHGYCIVWSGIGTHTQRINDLPWHFH